MSSICRNNFTSTIPHLFFFFCHIAIPCSLPRGKSFSLSTLYIILPIGFSWMSTFRLRKVPSIFCVLKFWKFMSGCLILLNAVYYICWIWFFFIVVMQWIKLIYFQMLNSLHSCDKSYMVMIYMYSIH